jgi:hypothetical protein
VHGDLRQLGHGNPFHEAPDKQFLCWHCFQRQFGTLQCFSTRQSRSVSLCGLPLCGWAIVAPRHFHFTITGLTILPAQLLQGRHLTNLLIGKVASYDSAMLNVTELFSKAILLPLFVCGHCMVVCLILYTCQQRVRLK